MRRDEERLAGPRLYANFICLLPLPPYLKVASILIEKGWREGGGGSGRRRDETLPPTFILFFFFLDGV